MLCEECHEREATVHLTFLTSEKALQRRAFCAICAPTQDRLREEALKKFLGDRKRGALSGEKPNDNG